MRYEILETLCGEGPAAGRFAQELRGIALDPDDRLLVVGDEKVVFFDRQRRSPKAWKTAEPGYAIAADEANVWVGGDGWIWRFDREGALLARWDDLGLGRISSLAVRDGEVFAGDAHARWIRRIDAEGRILNNIGDHHRKGGFHIPNGVVDFSLEPDGRLRVANPGMHRVETYSPEGEALGYFGRFDGQDPAGFPGCCNPTNVAVAPDERIVVTEKAGPRVKIYDEDGVFLGVVAGDESFEMGAKNMDVVVDRAGRIYVSDPVRRRVLVFQEVGE